MNHEKHDSYKEIIEEIKSIISQARSLTVRSINAMQVASNYLIGQRIVEFEQGGSKRAEYGKALLKELSNELISEFGRGYSHRNLDLMKNFYLTYKRKPISQTVSAKLISDNSIAKSETLSAICWTFDKPVGRSPTGLSKVQKTEKPSICWTEGAISAILSGQRENNLHSTKDYDHRRASKLAKRNFP